jgi:hypothetical protein
LSQAKITVPAILEALGQDGELVFVDYSDPDDAWRWVCELGDARVTVVRFFPAAWWQMNHARNLAGVAALGRVLVFCDVDWVASRALVEECARVPAGYFGVQAGLTGAAGFLAVRAVEWHNAGGYEEAIVGYGEDDHQMVWMLGRRGLRRLTLDSRVQMLPRDDQVRCLEVTDLGRLNTVNVKIVRALRELLVNHNNVSRNWGLGGEVVQLSRWHNGSV